jgi:hypothetical protein
MMASPASSRTRPSGEEMCGLHDIVVPRLTTAWSQWARRLRPILISG